MALQFWRESYLLLFLSTLIDSMFVQSGKACSNAITLLGIAIAVRPVQPWKASLPIICTPFGMVIAVRPVQPWNALCFIVVTLLGMLTEVRLVQRTNANSSISFTS